MWPIGLLFFSFNVFSIFHSYLPLEKGRAFHLFKLESPSPKNALHQVWFKLAQWFLRRRSFIIRQCIFTFHYYLPLEINVASHLNKLESPLPKITLCQVWLKLIFWFWRRKCFNLLLFRNYLHLKKGRAHHLNKFESP